jgi:hypothetical protein
MTLSPFATELFMDCGRVKETKNPEAIADQYETVEAERRLQEISAFERDVCLGVLNGCPWTLDNLPPQ